MVRVLKFFILAMLGVFAGALIGAIAGMAYMEFSQHGCAGAACADLIARSFIPGGAIGGGMAALITARPRERLNRF